MHKHDRPSIMVIMINLRMDGYAVINIYQLMIFRGPMTKNNRSEWEQLDFIFQSRDRPFCYFKIHTEKEITRNNIKCKH